MPVEHTRCQYIDPISHFECDNWYPYDPNEKYCPNHRPQNQQQNQQNQPNQQKKELSNHAANGIARSKTYSSEYIELLNQHITECLNLTLPQLAEHIKDIESKLAALERDRRAANYAKEMLKERLTEEEREALREENKSYKSREGRNGRPKSAISNAKKKTPEERAAGKTGFDKWAAIFDTTRAAVMAMDEDELAAKIERYKKMKS